MKKQPRTTYWTIDRLHEVVVDRHVKKMTLEAIAAKHDKHYQSIQHALKSAEAKGIRAVGA